jgi:hypothetical protein
MTKNGHAQVSPARLGTRRQRQSGNAQVIHRLLKAQAETPSKKERQGSGIVLLAREGESSDIKSCDGQENDRANASIILRAVEREGKDRAATLKLSTVDLVGERENSKKSGKLGRMTRDSRG